jgi:glycosyltransferase involved in cell wall biosynthesis
MTKPGPRITVCIPHWQVQRFMTVCLRSICRHSSQYNLEVIVVDNGSRDASLDYLRSLSWVRLIERPEEVHTNWPNNVFTAWDRGIREATGEFFVTMHSDVFVKRDDWLDIFLRAFGDDQHVAGVGAWKLNLENPLYVLQKRVIGHMIGCAKSIARRRNFPVWQQGHYPRDYCAMYRTQAIRQHNLKFWRNIPGSNIGGGFPIAKQLWDAGYSTRMMPVGEVAKRVVHVAHGTAGVSSEKSLKSRRNQNTVERRVEDLFNQPWVRRLEADGSLDGQARAA